MPVSVREDATNGHFVRKIKTDKGLETREVSVEGPAQLNPSSPLGSYITSDSTIPDEHVKSTRAVGESALSASAF